MTNPTPAQKMARGFAEGADGRARTAQLALDAVSAAADVLPPPEREQFASDVQAILEAAESDGAA